MSSFQSASEPHLFRIKHQYRGPQSFQQIAGPGPLVVGAKSPARIFAAKGS
jgi:hypothetical protein